jgi:hypothetical protein
MITTAPGGGVITPDTTIDSTTHSQSGEDALPSLSVAYSASQGHPTSAPASDEEERRLFDAYIASVSATNAAYTAWYAAWRRALEAQS